jgi:hypothetical protein
MHRHVRSKIQPAINISLPINQEPETADEYLAGKLRQCD